jgi:hypothetical protein
LDNYGQKGLGGYFKRLRGRSLVQFFCELKLP